MGARWHSSSDASRWPALAGAVLVLASAAQGAQTPGGLAALPAVAIVVELEPEARPLSRELLERRLTASLARAPGAPRADPASRDRLRLAVGVERIGASDLRGFWLPFSGDYAVGTVRLALERPARLESSGALLPVLVWAADRPVATAWARAPEAILAAVDRVAESFRAACAAAAP